MVKSKNNLNIQYVLIKNLKEAKYNPRKLTKKQEKDITESLKRFGCVDPLIVNKHKTRNNVLVGGHQRYRIMKKMGYKQVPVVYVNLTLKKEKELNIRLNANVGEWDNDLLKNFETDLLLDVGFDSSEISNIWDDSLEIENDNFNKEKELKKIKSTTIKAGNMFFLGQHVLMCGDSTKEKDVKKLIGKEKANIILCDPPYNINVNYDKGIGGNNNYGGKVDDNKSLKEYKEFIAQTISNGLAVSQKSIHVFYFCDQRYVGLLQDIYLEHGINFKRTCLWVKNGFNVTPKIAFNKCYEPCVYGTVNKPYLSKSKNLSEILNQEIETGNQAINDIIDIFDMWLVKRLPGQEYEHPTQKPTTLYEKPLKRCTQINDIVLELFGGSGASMLACEQLKRRCFVMEKDPIFCQLIINRFEKYAKTKIKKIN